MFACLQVNRKSPGSIWEKLLDMLTKPVTEALPVRLFGAEYLSVTACTTPRHGIDWEELARLVLPYTRCLLTPNGFEPPDGLGFTLPTFAGFERQVLLRTACALVENTEIPVYRRVVGLIDPDGSAAGMLAGLLRFYSSARVITKKLPLYRSMAERMMEELGAPVVISDQSSDFADCVLLLCPGPIPEGLPVRPRCPVLAGDKFAGGVGCEVFSGLQVRAGGAVAEIPPGIDHHEFVGAMYEHCGVELSSLRAESLLINGRTARLEEARRSIVRKARIAVTKTGM